MKITKKQLRRIIREAMASYGTPAVVSFKLDDANPRVQRGQVMNLFEDLLDGSAFLMSVQDYSDLMEFVNDAIDDGDEDLLLFYRNIGGTSQGQYIRIAMR